jgi:hypothetical protein
MAIIGQLAFTNSPAGYCFQSIIGSSIYAVIRNLNNTSPVQSWVALSLTGAGSVIGSYTTREAAMNACQTNYASIGQLQFIPCPSDYCVQSQLGPAADNYAIIRNINQTSPVGTPVVAANLGGSSSIVGVYGSRDAAVNACQVSYNALSS